MARWQLQAKGEPSLKFRKTSCRHFTERMTTCPFPSLPWSTRPCQTIYSHQTPEALMMGFQGNDPETIDTGTISSRYQAVLTNKVLMLSGKKKIKFDMEKDMVWRFDQVLKTHPNGMRFSVFGKEGELLATNEYFRCGFVWGRMEARVTNKGWIFISVGGGFVVNEKTKSTLQSPYWSFRSQDPSMYSSRRELVLHGYPQEGTLPLRFCNHLLQINC